MVIFYHASVRNIKKIISHIYVELCYSKNEIFHIFMYITAVGHYAKRQKIQSSIIFYRILHKIANILIYKTLRNDYTKLEKRERERERERERIWLT